MDSCHVSSGISELTSISRSVYHGKTVFRLKTVLLNDQLFEESPKGGIIGAKCRNPHMKIDYAACRIQ